MAIHPDVELDHLDLYKKYARLEDKRERLNFQLKVIALIFFIGFLLIGFILGRTSLVKQVSHPKKLLQTNSTLVGVTSALFLGLPGGYYVSFLKTKIEKNEGELRGLLDESVRTVQRI